MDKSRQAVRIYPWVYKILYTVWYYQLQFTVQTNNMSRKAVWCFTVPSTYVCENDLVTVGKDGSPVEYNNKRYTIVIGPQEDPDNVAPYIHHHGYIQCPPGCVLTKGQASTILKAINLYSDGMYLHELETTKGKYHAYCFKSDTNCHTSAERAIKRAMDNIEEDDGVKITPKRLKAKLAQQEGASFVARNKQVIDVVLNTPEIRKDKKTIEIEVDETVNMKNYMQAIANFNGLLDNAIKTNGIVTTHPAFVNTDRTDQVNAIMCIALLPALARRVRVTDKLPALWFHGMPHCGKSYLFSQIPNYKRVATDADGVSRFRMDGDQTAYLIDDIDAGWLFKPTNSKTLKALAIGEREVVKTLGDTQEVRGFVVFTSNCIPDHLAPLGAIAEGVDRSYAEKEHQFNCNAWKRRVVSVYFDTACEYEADFIDFELNSLDSIARKAFEVCYDKIKNDNLRKLLSVYYTHISAQWTDVERKLYENVYSSIKQE